MFLYILKVRQLLESDISPPRDVLPHMFLKNSRARRHRRLLLPVIWLALVYAPPPYLYAVLDPRSFSRF